MKLIGIIGAMDEEIQIVKEKMELKEKVELAGMTFYKGNLVGKDIVVVRSGIGKVNAAVCTQILISNFHVDAIINTGVAGAIHDELEVGDIVISKDVIEHDFDVTGFGGYKLGQIPRMDEYIFKADEKLVKVAVEASKKESVKYKTTIGRIVSGDVFVACPDKKGFLWKEFEGYCAEMESAAIGHTCYLNKVPFVIIRAMSDKADGTAHVNFNEFVQESANNSVEIVLYMLTHI
ncbi:5'-methylthioadenosine/adenosylhomocysteine nucleosidase [Crassaminicella thermophila]|uniref:adenosylhomocysteine nucleosidase n=1 Tax=Crassaminicella thermophila TaxID=2599308 RepID=A0A5C0SBP3_CRATE|nr:5'-methylthioadenosine/adenosylhomocysteine nucleosidase [Crassaminicella thermophila]QEK11983.1 5'-methylthioadenosine/adenosylhomocysteine nucleosidase [Crassaminicella thermophila]